jgi:cytoskeletal protein RodZ
MPSTILLVGLGVGALIFILIIGIILFLVVHHEKSTSPSSNSSTPPSNSSTPPSNSSTPPSNSSTGSSVSCSPVSSSNYGFPSGSFVLQYTTSGNTQNWCINPENGNPTNYDNQATPLILNRNCNTNEPTYDYLHFQVSSSGTGILENVKDPTYCVSPSLTFVNTGTCAEFQLNNGQLQMLSPNPCQCVTATTYSPSEGNIQLTLEPCSSSNGTWTTLTAT